MCYLLTTSQKMLLCRYEIFFFRHSIKKKNVKQHCFLAVSLMSGISGPHYTLPPHSTSFFFSLTHTHTHTNYESRSCSKADLVVLEKEMERKVGGEMERAWGLASVPAPPASLDPSHLPQLLPGFNCHSNWQWTQSPVIIVAAWWLGQVMPPFQDLSGPICSS